MQPFGGARNAIDIFNARIAKSRFMRLLTTARQGLRRMDHVIPAVPVRGYAISPKPSTNQMTAIRMKIPKKEGMLGPIVSSTRSK